MKGEAVKICLLVAWMVPLAALQDLAPVTFGVKVPLLAVIGCTAGIPAAVAAGLFTDALGGLPFGFSAVFFVFSALAIRGFRGSRPWTAGGVAMAVALHTAWLLAWSGAGMSAGPILFAVGFALAAAPVSLAAVERTKARLGLAGKEPK